MQRLTVVLLCLGHLATDINQGALPALLPFLIAEYGLSYTAAGFIVFATNITSSVVQPIFGHLADRRPNPWLLPAGILLAGIGMALTGFVPTYAWLLPAVMASGVGVAAFHPQGARIVNRVAAHQKAMAMSIFGVGGTLGFAIGPGLITAAVLAWGMPGTAILALPTTLMAAVVAWHLGTTPAETAAAGAGGGGSSSGTRDAWGAFARLTSAVIFRAILFFGLNTFIPLYWINVLGQSKAGGATALTIFAATGVAGNLIGGRLSDRFGPVRVAVVGFAALVPLVPALAATSHVPTALALLAATGFALSASYSPTVILGQAYLPNHVGLSAGVTLGLAITIGGVATPLLGRVADHSGLWATLAVLAALPIFSTAFALSLPRPGAHPAARG